MTAEEYLVKRIIELEAENNELKARLMYLEEKRTIRFEFWTSYNLKSTTYKIKLDNDNVSVKKEV